MHKTRTELIQVNKERSSKGLSSLPLDDWFLGSAVTQLKNSVDKGNAVSSSKDAFGVSLTIFLE